MTLFKHIIYLLRLKLNDVKTSFNVNLKFNTSIENGCVFYGVNNMYFNIKVTIGRNSLFSAENGKINVGANTSFNSNVHINSSICGEIIIGNNCLIGPNVVMRTAGHNFERVDIPIRKQGHICKNIIIHDDVWVGSNAVILGGVIIGKSAVIGAGAVVTKDVPEFAVVGGVPARIIKYRK